MGAMFMLLFFGGLAFGVMAPSVSAFGRYHHARGWIFLFNLAAVALGVWTHSLLPLSMSWIPLTLWSFSSNCRDGRGIFVGL